MLTWVLSLELKMERWCDSKTFHSYVFKNIAPVRSNRLDKAGPKNGPVRQMATIWKSNLSIWMTIYLYILGRIIDFEWIYGTDDKSDIINL